MQLSERKVDEIIDAAIERIQNDTFGNYLLERFPVRKTSATVYPDVNAVLKKHGSPACTDDKEVYVEPTIMRELLERRYPILDSRDVNATCREDMWRAKLSDEDSTSLTDCSQMVYEVQDVLLHELTHAFNEHTKRRIAMRNAREEDKTRFDIACELQANDGICGRTYEHNMLQRNKGVTNKRLHPETIGKHTFKGIYNAIKLNEQEQQGIAMAKLQAAAREALSKATGQYDAMLQEVKENESKDKNDGEKKPGCSPTAKRDDDKDEQTSDDKLVGELKKRGLNNIKELILSALSDELRYDTTTDSVIFDRVVKRKSYATYARPSRRIGAMGPGYNLLRKGVKYAKEYEYNKARKLTVLAVDASGSMRSQQYYVAMILDDLLKQVDAVAKEYGVEVHYENLQATMHRRQCDQFVQATSDVWANKMRNYRASGGNDFDMVLHRTNDMLRNNDYDAITIINLSDGLDELNDDEIMRTPIGNYIGQNKVQWVDAIIPHSIDAIHSAEYCKRNDWCDIRKQVIIAEPKYKF